MFPFVVGECEIYWEARLGVISCLLYLRVGQIHVKLKGIAANLSTIQGCKSLAEITT